MGAKTDASAGQVRLTGRLICGSERDAELVQKHLSEHIRLTRAEPGCLSFDVFQTDDPLIWQVEECFLDKEAFEFHRHRTRASSWGTATAGLQRAYEISGVA